MCHDEEIEALGWFEFSRREKIGNRKKISANQILRQNYGTVGVSLGNHTIQGILAGPAMLQRHNKHFFQPTIRFELLLLNLRFEQSIANT